MFLQKPSCQGWIWSTFLYIAGQTLRKDIQKWDYGLPMLISAETTCPRKWDPWTETLFQGLEYISHLPCVATWRELWDRTKIISDLVSVWEITCSLCPASVDLQDCIRLPRCNIGSYVVLRDCSVHAWLWVRKKYRELSAAWSKRLGGHQQVCAAIFLSSVVIHLWENPGLPHLLRRYPGTPNTIESVSLAVFLLFISDQYISMHCTER